MTQQSGKVSRRRTAWVRVTLVLAAVGALASCASGWADNSTWYDYSPRSQLISDEWSSEYDDGIGPPPCHPASLHPDLDAPRC